MTEPTLDQQIICVRREIALRRNVYQRRVAEQRMKRTQADHELLCMQAVLLTLTVYYPKALERIQELERALDVYSDEAAGKKPEE